MIMKAVTRSQYGSPQVLSITQTEIPKIKEDEILIQVCCTTVNRTDCANLTGTPYVVRLFTGITAPMKEVPGTDFAGEVMQVGREVTDFSPGDRVFGFDDNGLSSMAEYMPIAGRKAIRHIPPGITYEDAVASAEGPHYAINFLNKVKLRKGEKAMVNGGTGAIGSALIQILKFHGLYVVATGPTEHLDRLRGLGADRVIDYKTHDFTQDEEKFDYVFDSVGKSTFGNCKNLLLKDGIYISSELGPYAQNPFLAISTTFSGGKQVKFPLPLHIPESLKIISNLLGSGHYKPLIDRSYRMEEVREAFEYVMSGQKLGNVILNISGKTNDS